MLKRFTVFIVAITLLLLVACSKKDVENDGMDDKEALDNVNDSGMPIVKEPISLDFFTSKTPQTANDWNDVMIFNEYRDMTDMDINWEMVPEASLEEKRNLALASGNLPDAFYSASMPPGDILKYGEQGTFIKLNDLIDEYAPNIKKLFEQYPEIEKAITFPDGNIYSFPTIFEPDFTSMRMGAKPWINEEWLEALDMDVPETTEEFYNYLKAVKNDDPNGNGKQDEIPLGGPHMGWFMDYIKGAFGVGNRGPTNSNIDIDPETGDIRFYPISDSYKDMLEYVHKLYAEKLIEQNIYSIDMNQYLANASEGLYGATNWFSPIDIFGKKAGEKYIGMPALEGPNGDKQFSRLISPVTRMGSFIITSENENPAATVRWIDYFYGEEGMKLFFMGIEGKTFEKTDDGEYEFMDHITNNKDGLTFEQAASQYLTWSGGGYPSMATEKFFKGAESSPQSLKAAKKLEPDLIEETWPAFIYTKEESNKLDGFGNDIDKYVAEMMDKFITGDASFDQWDKYVKTVKDMKLDEYMDIKEAALKRYED